MRERSTIYPWPARSIRAGAPKRRRRGIASALSCVAAFLLASPCWAQDPPKLDKPKVSLSEMSLEELAQVQVQTVYAASKHEQKTSDAPSTITIITREDIRQFGYRTLADALRSVRGFYVTYDREYCFLGVRGFDRPGDYGGRILVTIDGHRLNDPIYDSNLAGTEFPLDLDLVERIEVIRGPGSSLYGNNAFFGIVNVITRRGGDIGGLEASASASSFDAYAGRVTYGRKLDNGLEFLVSGSASDSAGARRIYYPEFQSIDNGVAEDADGDAHGSIYGSLRFGDFSLSGGYGKRTKHIPTASFGSLFNNPNSIDRDAKGFADLRYHHTCSSGLDVQARAYFDHYVYDGQMVYPYNYADSAPPGAVTIDKETDTALSAGVEVQLRQKLWRKHTVTLGGEVRWDPQLDMHVYDVDPPNTWKDERTSASNWGVYLQDETPIAARLDLSAGLRLDSYDRFGSTLNPRVGLIYHPQPSTTLKLLYGEAFRAPNVSEYGYTSPGYGANPNLQPETIRSYEIALDQDLGQHLRGSVSLYWNDVSGLIGQTYDAATDTYINANLGGARARGVELGLEGHWAHGLRGKLSYTFADTVDTETDRWMTNSPMHLGQLSLAVPLGTRASIGLDVQAMSARRNSHGGDVPACAVANLTFYSKDWLKGWELSASIYNVLDTHYGDPVTADYRQDMIRQDGRTFRLKATYRL